MSNPPLAKQPKPPKQPVAATVDWATAARQLWEEKMAEVSRSATDALGDRANLLHHDGARRVCQRGTR